MVQCTHDDVWSATFNVAYHTISRTVSPWNKEARCFCFYRPPMKLREGDVFSRVCPPVGSQGAGEGVPPYTDASCNYRPQTNLWEGNVFTPVCHSVHRGEVYTPWVATAADGTHPTGMHSCSFGVDFCRNNYLNTIKEHRSPIFWSPCAFSCYIYDLYPSHIVRSYKNVLKSKELQLSLTIFALFNLISPTGFCT